MSDKEFDFSRSFEGFDGKSTFYIVSPSAKDVRGADWEYSKTYTKCLVEGITTIAEMTDILRLRGIIGEEFNQRSVELTSVLSDKVESLDNSKDSDEKTEAAIEVAIAREELFQWNQRLNAPLSNTCEQISDDTRLEYLTSCIIVDSEGARVWEDFDAYLVGKEQGLAQKSRFEVMLFLQGLDSDFLEKTPEAVAMKEVQAEAEKAVFDSIKDAEESVVEEVKPKTTKKKSALKNKKKVSKSK